MKDNWYAAKTTLDWLVCHFGLGGSHFAWLAPEFDMYRQPNPQSSNPHTLYHGFMCAWRDGDGFSQYVTTKRLSLCNAVEINVDAGRVDPDAAVELKEAIEVADVSLFYPLVYRVDLTKIANDRRKTNMGSGAKGSRECLIFDLRESEFNLLFAHFREDDLLGRMVLDGHGNTGYFERYVLLELVQTRRETS